jgi:hypothetical protein
LVSHAAYLISFLVLPIFAIDPLCHSRENAGSIADWCGIGCPLFLYAEKITPLMIA